MLPTKLPNFLCVGAQRAGTTTLHDILVQHPDVYLPAIKETKFFQNNDKYKRGLRFYQAKYFSKWNGEKAIGEIDPEYLFFEYVPERIYKHLGKHLKLVFLLRNPVDRAYSHYLMSYRRGYEISSFETAIELESERIEQGDFIRNHCSYISRGRYATQIKRYLRYFPQNHMLFIVFEQLKENISSTISQLFEFIEVSNVELDLNVKSNRSSINKSELLRDFIYKPNFIKKIGRFIIPNREIRGRLLMRLDKRNQQYIKPEPLSANFKKVVLEKYFLYEIKELEKIINKDLSLWYK